MDLQSSLKSYDNSLKKQETQYSGILGLTIDGSRKVNIPSRAGFVYVRLRDNLSEVVQAYNDKVSPAYGLPVIIQRTGNRWMVVGKDTNRYETWGTSAPFLPAHGSQHSFNRDVGVGGDTVWVYPDQFMPLLAYPSGTAGSTNLMVAPYLLKRDTDFIYAGNTGTQNLVMYKPADSQAILGLVVLNTDTGNPEILIASGTPISASLTGTSAIAPYIPYPASHQEPLYAFRLVSGTSYLTWDNLYNARQFIGGSSITSTGTSGGGNPAGNDRDVQFNNAGAFGADDQFIYQSDVKALGLGVYDLMPYDTTKLIWNVGDNVSPGIFGLAYGSTRAPYLGFAKADGTGTVPTNVKANQAIGRIRGYGYDGVSWSGVQAEITIVASADWVTGSYLPTRFDFDVTPSGSAIKRTQFQIHGDSVNIPTGSTYNVGGVPIVHSLQAGSGISINTSNPRTPIISTSGNGGGDKYPCEARLTLETGVAISTTDQNAKTSIHLTQFRGNQVAVYDGSSAWTTLTLGSDLSITLSTLSASLPHDIFAYNSSGSLAIEGLAWTNTTTRATALTLQNGVLVKSGATTRRYIGTIYLDGSKQCYDSKLHRWVYNYYNRMDRQLYKDVEVSHSYNSTTRYYNNDSSQYVDFVCGVEEDAINIIMAGQWLDVTTGSETGYAIVGLDGTTTTFLPFATMSINGRLAVPVIVSGFGVGYHKLTILEAAVGTITFVNYTLSGIFKA